MKIQGPEFRMHCTVGSLKSVLRGLVFVVNPISITRGFKKKTLQRRRECHRRDVDGEVSGSLAYRWL